MSDINEFQRKPYVRQDTLNKHKDIMLYIQNKISDILCDYENFDGVDFCDVNAGGIQVRGFHKLVNGYSYGYQPTIKYDFSNVQEVINDFVNMWKQQDVPQNINNYLNFLRDGERYGWD